MKSAFNAFCAEKREEVIKTYPEFSFGQIQKALGEIWKGLDEKQLRDYMEKADTRKANKKVKKYERKKKKCDQKIERHKKKPKSSSSDEEVQIVVKTQAIPHNRTLTKTQTFSVPVEERPATPHPLKPIKSAPI